MAEYFFSLRIISLLLGNTTGDPEERAAVPQNGRSPSQWDQPPQPPSQPKTF